MSVFDCSQQKKTNHDLTSKPYRAVPLSTRKIAVIVTSLVVFSVIYLFYAQHHKVLFYTMTSLIIVWIAFVYCAGILAVLYMVRKDYKIEDFTCNQKCVSTDESTI